MLEDLKAQVCKANLELVENGLVLFTWGNASGIDRGEGLVVIKPSGVPYDGMKPEDMVVVDLEGHVVEGRYRPSSDTATHIEVYKAFPSVGGIVHAHSLYATSWAQAARDIPCYGTTHADCFYGSIPCARQLTPGEIADGYERNTGKAICEVFEGRDILAVPGVLCASHGPFAFGGDPVAAVHNAAVLERCAQMAWITESLNPSASPAPRCLMDKHYFRKHGKDAYYGQGR